MAKPVYLVPMDFSTVSVDALKAATHIAKFNNGNVLAIHILSKKSEREQAKQQFETILNKLSEEDRNIISTSVFTGSVYDDIAKAAEITNANLIVMGTHGAKGMQKLMGSNALKIVSSTGTPFVIMQEGSSLTTITNIVMPFNFEKDSIQIATFAGFIAKQFDATIHLTGYHDEDDWLRGKSQTNQLVIRKFFDDNNVKYKIVNLPKSKTYINAILDYSDEVKADLIASSFFVDTVLPTMNSFVQALIENNRQIPLLTANADELSFTSGYSFIRT
ncbi:MAG: universal stress protein [Crocinitomicaceae bacterium]|nr:universal stress protein [Crocinitomicaceae bacterium]